MIEDITLSVPDVSCQHCVHAIDGALSGIVGVEQVTTDIPTKTVHLRFNPDQVTLTKIEAELEDIGYTVAK